MNRSLYIPAICSLFAFTGLYAVLLGAPRKEVAGQGTPAVSASESEKSAGLSSEDAKEVLTRLTGEFLQPWKQYESSPRRLYSRAAPRPIPSISASVELAGYSGGRRCEPANEHWLLATVTIKKGSEAQRIPCVIDRQTSDVRLFAGDQWVSSADWLKTAPMP